MQFKFKKLIPGVIGIQLPAVEGDAGYDLYAATDKTIPAHGSASITTGIAIQLPPGYWLEIMPKSGLATKHDISVHNGVIDNGYRGEIIVHLYNHSNQDYHFHQNDKIAQAVIRQQIVIELQEVDTLNETTRGTDGFGSTGK